VLQIELDASTQVENVWFLAHRKGTHKAWSGANGSRYTREALRLKSHGGMSTPRQLTTRAIVESEANAAFEWIKVS
jgi:hypothetical protein